MPSLIFIQCVQLIFDLNYIQVSLCKQRCKDQLRQDNLMSIVCGKGTQDDDNRVFEKKDIMDAKNKTKKDNVLHRASKVPLI